MLKRIKEFEDSKAQGYFSGFWRGKSEEEKDKDERDITEFKDKLNKEFQNKFSSEESKVENQMDEMLVNEPIFDQNALQDMSLDWVSSIYSIIIPKLRIVLLDEDSRSNKEKAIIEILSTGMKTKMFMGQDWQEVDLSFGKFNIIDNFSGSDIYQFLTETVFSGDGNSAGKDSVHINFKKNPRFEDGIIKLNIFSNARQYVFVNMTLIQKIQDFFNTQNKAEEKIDLSYYTEKAKIKALEYINQGADYMESNIDTEYVHQGIDADVEILAPVLVIPESISELTNK